MSYQVLGTRNYNISRFILVSLDNLYKLLKIDKWRLLIYFSYVYLIYFKIHHSEIILYYKLDINFKWYNKLVATEK